MYYIVGKIFYLCILWDNPFAFTPTENSKYVFLVTVYSHQTGSIMANTSKTKNKTKHTKNSGPPAKRRIVTALKYLLDKKDFNSITTVEIARHAQANEALIYRYFKDKRGLLHEVLSEYLLESHEQIAHSLEGITGAVNQLKHLIWQAFDVYNSNRIYAKILLIEVRSFPGYYKSETYQLSKNYSTILLNTLEQGKKSGELRPDFQPMLVRNIIVGGIEHLILPGLLFDREIPPDEYAEVLWNTVLHGIIAK